MAMAFHQELRAAAAAEWAAMIAHPFLARTAAGTIEPAAFHRWLAQDFHYAGELLRVVGVLLARAPAPLGGLLLDGLVALKTELALFAAEARARAVDLTVAMAPACRDYTAFLLSTAFRADLIEGWAAFYAQEQAYLDCWREVKSRQEAASPYQSFIDNWSSAGFVSYVAALAAALDDLAAGAAPAARARVERAFKEVVRYEIRFWDLAFE